MEKVQNDGIPIELHKITTSDGYILNLYRLPQANMTNRTKVMLLMHGMISASTVYVHYPETSAGNNPFFDHDWRINF